MPTTTTNTFIPDYIKWRTEATQQSCTWNMYYQYDHHSILDIYHTNDCDPAAMVTERQFIIKL